MVTFDHESSWGPKSFEFETSTLVSRESIAKKTKIRYEVIKSGRKVSKVDPHYSKL